MPPKMQQSITAGKEAGGLGAKTDAAEPPGAAVCPGSAAEAGGSDTVGWAAGAGVVPGDAAGAEEAAGRGGGDAVPVTLAEPV